MGELRGAAGGKRHFITSFLAPISMLGSSQMAKSFEELRQKMSPENSNRAERRASALLTESQEMPTPNDQPAVWDLVIDDMRARDKFGKKKYNTRLQPHNGRDYLVDAYQEALDLCVYLRGAIFERDGK